MKAGFTLLEIMVACAVLAVLFAVALPATSKLSEYNARTKSVSNLRQIGVAAGLYANEHEQRLPGQPGPRGSSRGAGVTSDQWPTLFCAYLSPSNPAVFLDPADPVASQLSVTDILSNVTNNTGYVYNGFDELGGDGHPPTSVPLNLLASQTETVLLAQKKPGASPFCLDALYQPVASLLDLLAPGACNGGAHYLFADGSVRYVKWIDYTNSFWLVDKTGKSPLPPLPPFLQQVPPPNPRYAGQPSATRSVAMIH